MSGHKKAFSGHLPRPRAESREGAGSVKQMPQSCKASWPCVVLAAPKACRLQAESFQDMQPGRICTPTSHFAVPAPRAGLFYPGGPWPKCPVHSPGSRGSCCCCRLTCCHSSLSLLPRLGFGCFSRAGSFVCWLALWRVLQGPSIRRGLEAQGRPVFLILSLLSSSCSLVCCVWPGPGPGRGWRPKWTQARHEAA